MIEVVNTHPAGTEMEEIVTKIVMMVKTSLVETVDEHQR